MEWAGVCPLCLSFYPCSVCHCVHHSYYRAVQPILLSNMEPNEHISAELITCKPILMSVLCILCVYHWTYSSLLYLKLKWSVLSLWTSWSNDQMSTIKLMSNVSYFWSLCFSMWWPIPSLLYLIKMICLYMSHCEHHNPAHLRVQHSKYSRVTSTPGRFCR